MTIDEGIITTKEKIKKVENIIIKTQAKIDNAPANFDKITEGYDEKSKQYWYDCALGHYAEDIKRNTHKLHELKQLLVKYTIKKSIEDTKKITPTVPIIEEFLDTWVVKSKDFYNNRKIACHAYMDDIEKQKKELCEKNNVNPNIYHATRDLYKDNKLDGETINKHMNNLFPQFVLNHIYDKDENWNEDLDIMLNKERENKKYIFYIRITEKVGNITDAEDLHIGNNGEINGKVIGDKGTVYIETITAGGYNIQCLHFRVLVHLIKEKTA